MRRDFLKKKLSLTAPVITVSSLALESFVEPHVLVLVEGAHHDLISFLRGRNVVAESTLDQIRRGLTVVSVADAGFQEVLLACKDRTVKIHLSGAIRIDQLFCCIHDV